MASNWTKEPYNSIQALSLVGFPSNSLRNRTLTAAYNVTARNRVFDANEYSIHFNCAVCGTKSPYPSAPVLLPGCNTTAELKKKKKEQVKNGVTGHTTETSAVAVLSVSRVIEVQCSNSDFEIRIS
jgi:hypothetical protein